MNQLVTQETGLETTGINISPDGELAVSAQASAEIQKVQGMILVAKRFRRNYDQSWQALIQACKRKTLAEKACYSYPRGGTTIFGPSVNLARVAAQCYGNMQWGIDILRDDEDSMTIRGWAWDIENNIQVSGQDSFKKLVYRKATGWTKPDERDLRELVNRRGAILVRNSLFNVLPRDLIEDAVGQTRVTLRSDIKDPNSAKKKILAQFINYGVDVDQINKYLGHKRWDEDDCVELNGVLLALSDGTAKVKDYFDQGTAVDTSTGEIKPGTGTLDTSKMEAGDPETHQDHQQPEPPAKRKRRSQVEVKLANEIIEIFKAQGLKDQSRMMFQIKDAFKIEEKRIAWIDFSEEELTRARDTLKAQAEKSKSTEPAESPPMEQSAQTLVKAIYDLLNKNDIRDETEMKRLTKNAAGIGDSLVREEWNQFELPELVNAFNNLSNQYVTESPPGPTAENTDKIFEGQIEVIRQHIRGAGVTDDRKMMKLACQAAGIDEVRTSFDGWTFEEGADAVNNISKVIAEHATAQPA